MEEERKLKVFRMNDFDHFADYSIEEAEKHYLEMVGETEDVIDDCSELTDEELDTMKIIFVDEEGQPEVTFREHLNGMNEPDIFCSTEA